MRDQLMKVWQLWGACLALFVGMALPGMAQGDAAVRFQTMGFNQMYELYAYNKTHGRSTLVTSDSMLHTAHILFDYTLRAAELCSFDKNLRELSGAMMTRMTAQAVEEAERRYFMAPPPYGYDRVAAYFAVGYKLQNPDANIPEIIRPLVEEELALIQAHNGMAISPIMGVTEDYTQYVPRGHYTRNEQFQRFFLAMLWFGRAGFPIAGEKSPGVPLTREEIRANAWAGMMLARNLDNRPLYRNPNSPTYLGLWQSIYGPTEFIIGTSDDLTPPEYAALSTKIFDDALPGAWLPDAQAKTDQFVAAAIALRPPSLLGTLQTDEVKSAPVALRFFGQRFTPDGDIFQQLVHPKVLERTMPSGLDVMAALGSATAVDLLKVRGEFTTYPQYQQQLDLVRTTINNFDQATWERTAYSRWLYALRALITEQPVLANANAVTHFPAWWTSPEWKAKQLNTALGSWAELRHDTILYVKQTYTFGVTSAPVQMPGALTYVEPVPEVYDRINTLVTTLRAQLTRDGVFPQEMGKNFDDFSALLKALTAISNNELYGGNPVPAATLAQAQNIGSILQQVETLPRPLHDELIGKEDTQMALIADVHTDPNTGKVLEVGVGNVASVVVPITVNGKTVQASGPIFAYYEFTQPMNQRLTDSAWQTMLLRVTTKQPFILGAYMALAQLGYMRDVE